MINFSLELRQSLDDALKTIEAYYTSPRMKEHNRLAHLAHAKWWNSMDHFEKNNYYRKRDFEQTQKNAQDDSFLWRNR